MICIVAFMATKNLVFAGTDDALVYYPLNEASGQAIDSKGLNNSVNVLGTQGAVGKSGTCYLFNGSSQKITFADSESWTLTANEDISFSAWINFTADNLTKWGNIWGNSANIGFGMKKNSAGNYSIFWYAGGTTAASSSFQITPGVWYHIAGIRVAKTSVSYYLNGALLNTVTPSDIDVNPPAVYIGGNEAASEFFNGKIDELGIWKRTLTANEVMDLYNNPGKVLTSSKVFSQSDNIGYYPVPAKDYLNLSNLPLQSQISIFDITGKKLVEKTNGNRSEQQVDLNGLKTGIYILKVSNSSMEKSFKIIRN